MMLKYVLCIYNFDVKHKLECCDIEYIIRLIKLYKNIFKVYLLFYEKILFCEVYFFHIIQ
jgi:hypothetical protein